MNSLSGRDWDMYFEVKDIMRDLAVESGEIEPDERDFRVCFTPDIKPGMNEVGQNFNPIKRLYSMPNLGKVVVRKLILNSLWLEYDWLRPVMDDRIIAQSKF